MNAIILAAGQATRIRSVHGEHPKCLIEVHNTSSRLTLRRGSLDLRCRQRKYRGRAITWRASACIAPDGTLPVAEVLRASVPELKNRSDYI
jgi:hypothetical protein